MQRLTGADATFLYTQTRNSHLEIAACLVTDAAGQPSGEALVDHAKAHLEPRLHLAPLMRRRLARVPLELDHPLWIEDPDFDLDYHVRHTALPPPGTMDQLGDLVGRLLSRPLDHTRPLWEMYLIEGLEHDRGAMFVKTHHAAIDGIAGFELVAALTDLEADAPTPPPPETPWAPDRVPSDVELLVGAAGNLARQPLRGARAVTRLARSAVDAQRRHGSAVAVVGETGAPPTRFNEAIGPHRRARFLDLSLSELKEVKVAAGAKLNDVILAVVSGGLRRYLLGHDELPEEPLLAFVPVSGRVDGDDTANTTSMMHVGLATELDDPVQRLEQIARASATAKERHADLGSTVMVDLSQFGGPALAAGALRIVDALRINQRTRLGGNVVVSNIPGPPVPLYTAGARIESMYPMGPVVDGSGLNITLLSYLDTLGFAINADRELVPDLGVLVDDLRTSARELRDAVLSPAA